MGCPYRRRGFDGKIDYQQDPAWAMAGAKRHQLRALLHRLHRSAETSWTHSAIALAAYHIWEEQGRPDGRADEHWRLAIERLTKRVKPG